MFTGIVEGTGKATTRGVRGDETRIRIEAGILEHLDHGASVAVDGVCLTVVESGPGWFEAVVSPETLSRTTLGQRDGIGVLVDEDPALVGVARHGFQP